MTLSEDADSPEGSVGGGGTFELALELGLTSNFRLQQSIKAIWNYAGVHGPLVDPVAEPGQDPYPIGVTILRALEETPHIAAGLSLPITVMIIREDDDENWLDICIPISALERTMGDSVPGFYSDANVPGAPPIVAVRRVENWLAGLAMSVFEQVPFRAGFIGWLVSGMDDADSLRKQGVPTVRDIGYLLPEAGSLRYYERTAYPCLLP